MVSKKSIQEKYQEIIDPLKTQRDELKLKVHLANMNVQKEWNAVEAKWEHLRSKEVLIKNELGASAHEIAEASSVLAAEIKESYKRIRRIL